MGIPLSGLVMPVFCNNQQLVIKNSSAPENLHSRKDIMQLHTIEPNRHRQSESFVLLGRTVISRLQTCWPRSLYQVHDWSRSWSDMCWLWWSYVPKWFNNTPISVKKKILVAFIGSICLVVISIWLDVQPGGRWVVGTCHEHDNAESSYDTILSALLG
jgi:hypothetical protein